MDLRHFLVVLAIVVSQLAPASLSQTCVKELEYPHNGRCCESCPPGYFKFKDCTRKRSTKCKRCEDGYYLAHPNFHSQCWRCTRCSASVHMEEKTPCRTDQNRVCQCMQGYYIPLGWVSEVCFKHTDCPPGEGVDRRGTRLSDTVCRPCAHGTFSNKESSRQKCKPWTDCALLGREEVEPGTSKRDAICGAKLTSTTQSVPPLMTSTVRWESTTIAASTSTTSTSSRSKPQPTYSLFSPKSTMSTSTTSARSSRSVQQTSDSAPLPKSTVASTTATPSKQLSTSVTMFIPMAMSSTASNTQLVSKMPITQSVSKMPITQSVSKMPITQSASKMPITQSVSKMPITQSVSKIPITQSVSKMPITQSVSKMPITSSPSSDEGISDYSNSPTITTTTTTPANAVSAHGNTKTDQRSTTPQSPIVTITQPRKSFNFTQFFAKAKPVTTPAIYTTTEMAEQKNLGTNAEPGMRNNGEQGNALHIPIIVTIPCLTLIAIFSQVAIAFICFRKKRKDYPVYFNNNSGTVTIGTPSQGADGICMGDSGTSDNNSASSGAVLSVEVHETENPTNTEDEHSPLISASGEHPEGTSACITEATLPSEVPEIPITDEDLVKLAKTIGPDWEAAGIQVLGITYAELLTCKENNPNNRNMQIFQMLKLWKEKQGKRAVTLRTLCELLTQAEVEYCVRVHST